MRELRILGTAPDPHFDAVCRTAALLFAVSQAERLRALSRATIHEIRTIRAA